MKIHLEFIRQKMPETPIREIQAITNGWDNDLYLVNGHLAFRFPKTEEVAKKVEKEMELLIQIKEQMELVLKVPEYTPHYGSNGELQCVSYKFLQGTTFKGLKEEQTDENARLLGTFLSQLHSVQPKESFIAEKNRQYWESFYGELQEKVLPQLPKTDRKAVEEVFGAFLVGFKEEKSRTIIHGDLTLSNIVSNQGKITGIIDFTDAHVGDAALDFAGLYWDCGPEFTKRALAYYEGREKQKLFEKVQNFYGLQPVFHELLYAVRNGEELDKNHALQKFHQRK